MGVSEEMKKWLATAQPLKPHNEHYIRIRGFLTGSVAFGVAGNDSDSDYVMIQRDFDGMQLGLDVLRYSSTELYRFHGYTSWYARCLGGEVFNLLVMSDSDVHNQYVYATATIQARMSKDEKYAELIRIKAFRVAEFQRLKNQYGVST